MPFAQLLASEVASHLRELKDARDFRAGQAAGFLMKAADTPESSYSLSGKLYLSRSNFLLLSVPNALVRGLFDAMEGPGLELPSYGDDDRLNAHITVFSKEEVDRIGGPISERGHAYLYQLGPIKKVNPQGWKDVSTCFFVEISSPALKQLRVSYGLTPLPHGDHPFHITVAVKRKNILRKGDVSKAAAYQEEPDSHFTHDGVRYDLNALLRMSADRPVTQQAVSDLDWVLGHTAVNPDRVSKANPDVPVLVAADREGRTTVVDGAHRLTRATQDKRPSIPARTLSASDLESAKIINAVSKSGDTLAATLGGGPSPREEP